MKKKLFVIAIIAVCLSIIAYGTTAFFTYEEKAINIISTSGIDIDLLEWTITEDGSLIPFEDVIGVVPATEVPKIVEIKNTGEQPVWVRIMVQKSIILAEGVDGEIDLSLVSMDINTSDWTEIDGYYYYNKALNPDETTSPLFTKVMFDKNMSNMYQDSAAVVEVTAQATQTAHNGESAFEAMGWPN